MIKIFMVAAATLLAPIAIYWVDYCLYRGKSDWVGRDEPPAYLIPLSKMPGIFRVVLTFPVLFSFCGVMRATGNTYHQGFEFIGDIDYGCRSKVQPDIYVKPFGFIILGFLSVCLLPAAGVYLLEAGSTSLVYYAILGCNKLLGARLQQPIQNQGFFATWVAVTLVHIGWMVISVPTSMVTLLVRACEQVGKGVVGLVHAVLSRTGLFNLAVSSQKPRHTSEMRVAVGKGEPLLGDKNAADRNHDCKFDEGEPFLSKGDTTKGSDHLYASQS